jgi:hypothetical protein
MSFIIGLLVGFAGAAILASIKPEIFNKITAAVASVVAIIAASWETLSGLLK